jgi:multidrug resistance efflux pump
MRISRRGIAQSARRQAVKLYADIYGAQSNLHGRVDRSVPAPAAFPLPPPQNATGNWIKVVQRVPVRIALDPAGVGAAPATARPVDGGRGRHA